MDKGVKFVLENFEKALELTKKYDDLKELKGSIQFEYDLIKAMKKTGDAYEYFLSFANEEHKNADKFKVLEEYGLLRNEEIADYLREHYSNEIDNKTTMDDFVVNRAYTNSDMYLMFNDFIRGIKYNPKKNIIAVVKSHDSLYGDTWDENKTLNYTGEGQEGDQTLTSAGNKALLSAAKNNTKIYLFDKIEKNKYYFRGEVYIVGSIKVEKEADKNNNIRQVIKFPLKLVDENTEMLYSEEDQEIIRKKQKKKIDALTIEQLHKMAKNKKKESIKKIVEVNYVERDQVVSKYTKYRANGKCDLCGEDAPFKTKEGPYLESHHVITIADGGPDVIYNTVALCPNCHRKMHSLKDPKDLKRLTAMIYKYLLDDDDKENLKQWENLFKDKN